eukprot:7085486-Prymnesium_polylepis.1
MGHGAHVPANQREREPWDCAMRISAAMPHVSVVAHQSPVCSRTIWPVRVNVLPSAIQSPSAFFCTKYFCDLLGDTVSRARVVLRFVYS